MFPDSQLHVIRKSAVTVGTITAYALWCTHAAVLLSLAFSGGCYQSNDAQCAVCKTGRRRLRRTQVECIEHDMDSRTDYRKLAHHHRGLYFTEPDRDTALHETFTELVNHQPIGPAVVTVQMGRKLPVPEAGVLLPQHCLNHRESTTARIGTTAGMRLIEKSGAE